MNKIMVENVWWLVKIIFDNQLSGADMCSGGFFPIVSSISFHSSFFLIYICYQIYTVDCKNNLVTIKQIECSVLREICGCPIRNYV